MRRCVVIAATLFVLALCSAGARAQAPCSVLNTAPPFQPGGNVFGATQPQWLAYFQGKVDGNNGQACNLSITGTLTIGGLPFNIPGGVVAASSGGTGINNGVNTLTLGGALSIGNMTSVGELVAVTGSGQIGQVSAATVISSLGGPFLLPANNLSDIDSESTARTNLGLGTAATQNVSVFAQTANNGSDFSTPAAVPANIGALPHVATLTALQGAAIATYGGAGARLVRDDFSTGLGAPAQVYEAETGTCSSNSRVNDGGSCANTTSGGNSWFAMFPSTGGDTREWGAFCNNSANDATALQAALTWAATNGRNMILPAGTCLFATALTAPAEAFAYGILGQGQTLSWLVYTGTNTTNDIVKLGSFTPSNCNGQIPGLNLQNFGIDSNTKMTGGSGLHIQGAINATWYNLAFTNQNVRSTSPNLWNGLWNDSSSSTTLIGFYAAGQNDAVDVSGQGNTTGPVCGENVDPIFLGGTVIYSNVGFHWGGGVGGAIVDNTNILNTTSEDALIDTAISSQPNDQVFYGPGSLNDFTTTGDNVLINTTTGTGPQYIFNGWIASAQAGNNVEIEKCTPNCQILFGSSATLTAAHKSNIVIDSTATGIGLLDVRAHMYAYNLAASTNAGIDCLASPTLFNVETPPLPAFNGSGGAPIAGSCILTTAATPHPIQFGPSPTVSSCSGSAAVSGSTDGRGIIDVASGATTCTLTFAQNMASQAVGGGLPVCVANFGAGTTSVPLLSSVGISAVTWTFSALSANTALYYHCDD